MDLFGVIDLYGLAFTAVLVVPHIIFAKTYDCDLSVIENRGMLYIERIGKYASALLMFVKIGVLELGFTSEYMKNYWLISTLILCAVYVLFWVIFFKRQNLLWANLITVAAAIIVIQSGILQQKTLLLTAGIVYIIGQIYVNIKFFKR